jgi:hypothetical protein
LCNLMFNISPYFKAIQKQVAAKKRDKNICLVQ